MTDDNDIQAAFSDFAEAANTRLSEQQAEIQALRDELDGTPNPRRQASAGRGRVTEADPMPSDGERPRSRATVLGPTARDHGMFGFEGPGHFLAAVRNAGLRSGGEVDQRLYAASATTFGNEGSGDAGGFLVPPEFRNTVLEKALG